jgi:hypothetical protein
MLAVGRSQDQITDPLKSLPKPDFVSVKPQYLAVGHPVYYTGLDYIYEDRGEVSILHTSLFFCVSFQGNCA